QGPQQLHDIGHGLRIARRRCRGESFGQFGLTHSDVTVPRRRRPLRHARSASAARGRTLCGTAVAAAAIAGETAASKGDEMRQSGLIAAIFSAVLLTAAAPATAQQQRDPFNGQFGVLEIAPQPREAAHLAKLMGDSLEALEPQRSGVQDVYLLSVSFWGDPVRSEEHTSNS